jgi:hypothetical protein
MNKKLAEFKELIKKCCVTDEDIEKAQELKRTDPQEFCRRCARFGEGRCPDQCTMKDVCPGFGQEELK